MEFCWHLRWQRSSFWECIPALFPSCSHSASARGRWEQLTASPPKLSLAPSLAHLTPAAAKAKTNMPQESSWLAFLTKVWRIGNWEPGCQVGSTYFLYICTIYSLYVPGGEQLCLFFSPSYAQFLAQIWDCCRQINLLTKVTQFGDSQFWKHGGLSWFR